MEYGSGAIFGCPAHDARDFEFAKKYDLQVLPVIKADDCNLPYQAEEGVMYNSGFLDGKSVQKAREEIIEKLQQKKIGKKKSFYRLRDWGVSRQRYWGCPIPIVYCPKCGTQPVNRCDLPVKLPEDIDFSKTGNPLSSHPTWKHTKCPKCNQDATRETDTFDTFFEKSISP